MRYHDLHPMLALWRDPVSLRRVVAAETLVAARFEPTMRQGSGSGVLDLTFVRGGEVAVVPFVQIDQAMFAEPENPPLIWPAAAQAALDDTTVEAIEASVMPWLYAHYLGRALNAELVRTFGVDDAFFDSARAYGFLGAAPYERVVVASAPYMYAVRFARGRSVLAIDEPAGASGIALLARRAGSIRASLGGPDADAAARAWFGLTVFDAPSAARPYDIVVAPADATVPPSATRIVLGSNASVRIDIARPIPSEVMISFDVEDSEAAGSFAISAPVAALRRPIGGPLPAPVGGSGGRLLFALRDDWSRAPDADVDEAHTLATRLRGEGFEVDLRASGSVRDLSRYDLVHVFTMTAAADHDALLGRAREAGLPIVATPHLDDVTAEGIWGAGMSAGLHRVAVDNVVEEHRRLFERRILRAEGLDPAGSEPFAGYRDLLVRDLARCDALLVSGAAEERLARTLGYAGYIGPVGPAVDAFAPAGETGHLTGDGFVFAHGPVGMRSNFLTLGQAAMAAGLPLVIAGPVSEADYLALLRERTDERVALISDPTPHELAGLYRRARVYADVGWVDPGSARAARAALCGASLVLSRTNAAVEQWDCAWGVDRVVLGSVAVGLTGAWAAFGSSETALTARRVAAACEPAMVLSGVAAAYAHAGSLRS